MTVRGKRQNVKFQPLFQPRITTQVSASVTPIQSSLEAKFKQVEQARKQKYALQNKNSRFVAQMAARTGAKPPVNLNTPHAGQPANTRGTGRGRGGAAGGRRGFISLEGRLGGKQPAQQQMANNPSYQQKNNQGNSSSNISQRGYNNNQRGYGQRGGAGGGNAGRGRGTASTRGRGGAPNKAAAGRHGRGPLPDQATLDAELDAYMLKDPDYAANKLEQELDNFMNVGEDSIWA